jgi:hypothetical protein
MSQSSSRWLALSLPRRFMGELLHFAQRMPSRTIQRKMRLAKLVAARQAAWPRPGWCAIFLKAYALVADRRPHLRHLYRPFPWPHLYQHPDNVASIAITREYGDDEAVFFARLASPEKLGLLEIDRELKNFKDHRIDTVAPFRSMLRLAGLPQPLRRLAMWLAFHGPGRHHAEHLGTFGVNVVSSLGASSVEMLSPWTTALSYDVFAAEGTVDVRVTYDLRVRDAATIARVLADLEEVLTSEIVNELGYLQALEAA